MALTAQPKLCMATGVSSAYGRQAPHSSACIASRALYSLLDKQADNPHEGHCSAAAVQMRLGSTNHQWCLARLTVCLSASSTLVPTHSTTWLPCQSRPTCLLTCDGSGGHVAKCRPAPVDMSCSPTMTATCRKRAPAAVPCARRRPGRLLGGGAGVGDAAGAGAGGALGRGRLLQSRAGARQVVRAVRGLGQGASSASTRVHYAHQNTSSFSCLRT